MPDQPDSGKTSPDKNAFVRPTLTDQHWRASLRRRKSEDLDHDMTEAIEKNNGWRFHILLQLDLDWARQDFLRKAVEHGRAEMFGALVEKNPDWKRSANINALADEAAEAGRLDFVKLFVETHGADIHHYSEEMLRAAARKGHEDVVGYLLEKGATLDAWNGEPMRSAIDNGHLGVVKRLVEAGAKIDGQGNPLENAARGGHLAVVEYLLEKGADPKQGDSEALVAACRNGHAAIAKLLLEKGANANARDSDAFFAAAENKQFDIAKLLLEHGADPANANGGRVLRSAAGRGEYDVAKFLLGAGANPNASQWRDTPLTEAARVGDSKMARLLMRHGADIGALGYEALRVARRNRNTGMAKALIQGARDAVVFAQEQKFLEFGAAFKDDYSVDDLRAQKGASGDTGLMLAAQSGKFVEILRAAKGGRLEPGDLFHPDDRVDSVMTLLQKNKQLQQFFDPGFWVDRTSAVVEAYESMPGPLQKRVNLGAIKTQINQRVIMQKAKNFGNGLKPPKIGGH